MLSGKHEFKIFQQYGYFSSDSAESGLSSDPLTALVKCSTVDSCDLDFAYLEWPLMQKWKSGPCFNMNI